MSPTPPDAAGGGARLRGIIETLIRDGAIRSRSDQTDHTVFPVAISPAEGEANPRLGVS